MRIKEISYSRDVKIQVNQYEPKTAFVSMTAEVGEKENADQVFKELKAKVVGILDNEVKELEKEKEFEQEAREKKWDKNEKEFIKEM